MSDGNKFKFVTKSVLLITTVALLATTFCKPSELNNASDPNSKSFFENALLLCALGYYQACNSCSPAPGPWGSFVGTPTTGFTAGFKIQTDRNYNLFGFGMTTNDFGASGVNFQGTPGSTTNIFASKFSNLGTKEWFRYLGQRSDRPNGLIHIEDDGLYAYFTTPTSTIPGAISSHTNNGNNTVITKLSTDGTFLWTKYLNDGTTAESAFISDIVNSSDKSGLYILGFTRYTLVNAGTVIGSPSGNDWFIQKISYDGNTQWTRYYAFGSNIDDYRPNRIVEIPNGNGYYIVSLAYAALLLANFPNQLNTYPGAVSSLVMKLDSDFNYQWHRYLGGGSNASDNVAPSLVVFPDQTLISSALYTDTTPSDGLQHPGTGIDSTILYRLNGSGNLLFSTFVYNPGESVTLSDAKLLSNSKVLISGTISNTSGISSELDPVTLREDYRITGKENFKSASIKHCDDSFSSIGSSDGDISDSPIPFGSGTSNAYFSRYKR